ncbi:MAG: hypothetical protein FWC27_13580 [Firmicutes bacterium]|nr:hypothetical protein [Bacillota bacterium]
MPSVLEYKCPCCNAGINFDSTLQRMKCPYCETEFDAEALRQFNAVQEEQHEEPNWEEGGAPWDDAGLQGYRCPSCAGELIGDATTAATRCPYCGNPAVLPAQLRGSFRPEEVIPFKLDKQAAVAAFGENLKGKRLLPKKFRDENTLGEITGVYVPFWLFDCRAGARVNYRATRTATWSDKHYQYTKTDHYQLRRAGEASFARIPADGSQKMDDAMMDAVEPYDYRELRPFQMTYLSGYLADRYDVGAQECGKRAERRAAASLQSELQGTTAGFGACSAESEQYWVNHARARYALLPVWTLNCTWRDKLYRFAMNGQTGKFIGELPVDKGRTAAWFFGIFGGVAALGAVLAVLLGGVL